jgi:hypothetical protein
MRDHTQRTGRSMSPGRPNDGGATWCVVALTAWLVLASTSGSAQAPLCPRPGLARLASLVGTWTVDWKYKLGDQMLAVDRATATIEVGTAGCSVQENLDGTLYGKHLAITKLIAAPTTDSLQLAYVDSDHGGVLLFGGSVHSDTIRLEWSRDLGTRRLLVRHEYTVVGPTAFSTKTVMSPNSGQDWIVVQRAEYRRNR